MTRDELVLRAKEILSEAYEAAAEMVVLYLEKHPAEQRYALCREIDPENYDALDAKVRRRQKARNASGGADLASTTSPEPEWKEVDRRAARRLLRDPDERERVLSAMEPTERAAVVRAAVPPPERIGRETSAPTFIDLLVKVSGSLIELEAMVAGWQNRAAVPTEFSRESFNDVVAKVLRIQDAFDALDADDDDEFQKIVRNFRVTSDV